MLVVKYNSKTIRNNKNLLETKKILEFIFIYDYKVSDNMESKEN